MENSWLNIHVLKSERDGTDSKSSKKAGLLHFFSFYIASVSGEVEAHRPAGHIRVRSVRNKLIRAADNQFLQREAPPADGRDDAKARAGRVHQRGAGLGADRLQEQQRHLWTYRTGTKLHNPGLNDAPICVILLDYIFNRLPCITYLKYQIRYISTIPHVHWIIVFHWFM